MEKEKIGYAEAEAASVVCKILAQESTMMLMCSPSSHKSLFSYNVLLIICLTCSNSGCPTITLKVKIHFEGRFFSLSVHFEGIFFSEGRFFSLSVNLASQSQALFQAASLTFEVCGA
jgi:hypothetical protein